MKRWTSIARYLQPALFFIALILIWQLICQVGWAPRYMLPSPVQIIKAFVGDFGVLAGHAGITLAEALIGLLIGLVFAVVLSVFMERFSVVYRCAYPLLILSQTIPSIALAPLLVLWMGYGMAPKIALVVLMTFFPISIGLLSGFRSIDREYIAQMKSMRANEKQIFFYVKLPGALESFFAGLKISVSYAIIGAVIAEWLGGFGGLGVYMTRVRKSYSYDKMFAVIFLICILSLILVFLVSLLQKRAMPWKKGEKEG